MVTAPQGLDERASDKRIVQMIFWLIDHENIAMPLQQDGKYGRAALANRQLARGLRRSSINEEDVNCIIDID